MGTFVRRMLYVVGSLTVLFAGAVAVYVGPGDVVRLPGTTVAGGAPVTVVPWELLGYTGTTLQVQTSASPGPVFVAAAHPVDLASWLGGTRVTRVRAVERTGDLTVEQSGVAQSVPTDAGTATFWVTKASGAAEATLQVPLTGLPVSVVVLSPAGATLTMSLGASLPGLHRLALAVGACAVLVLLLAVSWTAARRRRRRRAAGGQAAEETPASTRASAPSAPSTEPAVRPGVAVGSADRGRSSWTTRRRGGLRRSLAATLVLLGVGGTAGCLAVPQAVPAPTGPVSRPALSGEAAPAATSLLADYDKRNNAVIGAIAKGGRVDLWATVDGGSVLQLDRYSTVLDRGLGEAPSTHGMAPSLVQVYVPGFVAYPMSVVVETTQLGAKGVAAKARTDFEVYQRDSVSAPWKLVADAVRDASAPKPAPPGRVVSPSAAQKKQVQALVGRLAGYLGKGQDLGFAPSTSLKAVRQTYVDKPQPNYVVTTDCFPKVDLSDALASTTVVPTSTGRLLVVNLVCTVTYGTSDGSTLGWRAPYAKALHTDAGFHVLLDHLQAVTVVLSVEDSGRVVSLGAQVGRIPYS